MRVFWMLLSGKGLQMLLTLAMIPLTCWLCALIATPRKPHIGDELAELIYLRLLGRQQRLILLAFLLTGGLLLAVVLALPQRIDRPLQAQESTLQYNDYLIAQEENDSSAMAAWANARSTLQDGSCAHIAVPCELP